MYFMYGAVLIYYISERVKKNFKPNFPENPFRCLFNREHYSEHEQRHLSWRTDYWPSSPWTN